MPQQRSRTILLITAVIVLFLTIVVILLAQRGATQGAREGAGLADSRCVHEAGVGRWFAQLAEDG